MENVPREDIDRMDGVAVGGKESQLENEASLLEKPPTINSHDHETMKVHPQRRQMDGGLRAWLIVLSSFMCNGLIFGVINSYSLVYGKLEKILEENGVEGAGEKAALVGSLTLGTTFILSPVAGVVTDKIGMRYTVLLGGLFTSSGMFFSSFVLHDINVLYLTYGVMYGIGAAFTYSPSLAVLGHYFEKYLGKVTGFATTGSSVFTAIMPFVYNHLLEAYSLAVTLRIIAMLSSLIVFCAILYESPAKPEKTAALSLDTAAPAEKLKQVTVTTGTADKESKSLGSKLVEIIKGAIYMDNWRKKRYVIWVLGITISQLGYFIPYVHMRKFAETDFPGYNPNLPVACIGIASGIGRLIFGFVADLPNVNRIVMHQISVALVGITTMILAGVDSYMLVIICVLALGLCDGCYVTLMGPIAIEICGPRGGSQAIGFLLGLCSIPLTLGPVIASSIFDSTGSYSTVFLISGLSPIVATVFLFLIRCVNDEPLTAIRDAEAPVVAKAAWEKDNSDTELHSLTKKKRPTEPEASEALQNVD